MRFKILIILTLKHIRTAISPEDFIIKPFPNPYHQGSSYSEHDFFLNTIFVCIPMYKVSYYNVFETHNVTTKLKSGLCS